MDQPVGHQALCPLLRGGKVSPNDSDGRQAECPVLRTPAIRRDVVWPKAASPLTSRPPAEADVAVAQLIGLGSPLLDLRPTRRGWSLAFKLKFGVGAVGAQGDTLKVGRMPAGSVKTVESGLVEPTQPVRRVVASMVVRNATDGFRRSPYGPISFLNRSRSANC
jgi:hypothetical protein